MEGAPAPPASESAAPFSYLLEAGADVIGNFSIAFTIPPGETALRIRAEDRAGNWTLIPELAICVLQPDLGRVVPYPNPYKTTMGLPGVQFINLTAQCEIKIFTIAGELVKTAGEDEVGDTGSYLWNLQNDAGDTVASGIYIYHIKNQKGQTKQGKMGIIR